MLLSEQLKQANLPPYSDADRPSCDGMGFIWSWHVLVNTTNGNETLEIIFNRSDFGLYRRGGQFGTTILRSKFLALIKSDILGVMSIKILVLIFLLYPSICLSDLYFWVDNNGVKHYSNIQSGQNPTITKELKAFSDGNKIDRDFSQIKKEKSDKKADILLDRKHPIPRVTLEYKYYEVMGVNMNDLRTETIKNSPIKQNGTTFRGRTEWYMKPYYRARKKDNMWYLDDIVVKIDVTILMPKWVDYPKANRDEQIRWDNFYKKLLEHESTHKDIDIAAARKLCRTLAELKTTEGKRSLLQLANKKDHEIYKECKIKNEKFDKETNHGGSW